MAAALALATEHGGKLVRRTHGCWTYPDAPREFDPRGVPEWFVRDATVQSLIARGELKVLEHKTVRMTKVAMVVVITALYAEAVHTHAPSISPRQSEPEPERLLL
jgi:hypothetical protein